MKSSKNSISCTNLKKDQHNSISPFQVYTQIQPQFLSSHRFTCQSNQQQIIFHTCLSHSLSLTNICFTCNFALLCSNCLNEGLHKNHDFRNLQKGFSYMKNSLKQYVIKLQAKFNLLTNLTEQLSKCKIDIFSEAEDYKFSVQQQFKQLIEQIQAKQIQIILKVQKLKQQHQKQMQRTIIDIKRQQNNNLQCQKHITEIIQNANQKRLQTFFQKEKQNIQQVVDQKIINELEKNIYQISWGLDFQQINIISHKLKNLKLTCNTRSINPNILKSQLSGNKKLAKYKSQTHFKYKEEGKIIKKQKNNELQKTLKLAKNQRNQKQRDSNKSYGTFCMTPKQNCSRQKHSQKTNYLNNNKQKKTPENSNLIKKRKKSSGKNISMPVSPIKQQRQSIPISQLNIDAMKKKKVKKNV